MKFQQAVGISNKKRVSLAFLATFFALSLVFQPASAQVTPPAKPDEPFLQQKACTRFRNALIYLTGQPYLYITVCNNQKVIKLRPNQPKTVSFSVWVMNISDTDGFNIPLQIKLSGSSLSMSKSTQMRASAQYPNIFLKGDSPNSLTWNIPFIEKFQLIDPKTGLPDESKLTQRLRKLNYSFTIPANYTKKFICQAVTFDTETYENTLIDSTIPIIRQNEGQQFGCTKVVTINKR